MNCPNCNTIMTELTHIRKNLWQCVGCHKRLLIKPPKENKLIPPEILISKLKEAGLQPYMYHLAFTGSYYIKFEDFGLRTIRVANHNGRKKYKYKWNLRSDITKSFVIEDKGVKRFFYPTSDLTRFINHLKLYLYKVQNGERRSFVEHNLENNLYEIPETF